MTYTHKKSKRVYDGIRKSDSCRQKKLVDDARREAQENAEELLELDRSHKIYHEYHPSKAFIILVGLTVACMLTYAMHEDNYALVNGLIH